MDKRMEPLVEQYMSVAQTLAQHVWRTAPHALELEELKAIAYLGLVDAAQRWYPYCEERGYSPEALEYFRPFVTRRVYGSLIDAMRSSDWASRGLRARAKALIEAGIEQGVSHEELSRRTGLTITEIRSTIRGMARQPTSLEAEDIDPPTEQDVESSVITTVILERLVEKIQELDFDQQVVLALHYHDGLQLQKVASLMGITKTYASQLHAEAVLTIHSAMVAAIRQEEQ